MNNYQNTSMNDIVFEGRNKQYGAYQLRQNINKNSSIGLLVTISAFTALLLIYKYNPFQNRLITPNETIITCEFANIKEIAIPETVQPKQLPSSPPPKVNTVDAREMQAVADKVATTAAPISLVDNADKNFGTTTVTDGIDKPITQPIEPTNHSNTAITETPTNSPTVTDKIVNYTDVMPTFIGGKDALMDYLKNNIKPFSSDIEKGLSGRVVVRFYIDTDGSVRNPEVIKDEIGGRCGEAAITAIKKMPKWNAGKQKGNPVKVYFTLPVTFNFTLQ